MWRGGQALWQGLHSVRRSRPEAFRLNVRDSPYLSRRTSTPTRYVTGRPEGGRGMKPQAGYERLDLVRAGGVGLGAGTLGALGGVGGSAFVIPGLMRFIGLSQREAAGCSLFAVTTVAATSAVSHASAGTVDWSLAGTLACSAAIFTPVGAVLAARVHRHTLQRLLGGLMIVFAPTIPLRARFRERQHAEDGVDPSPRGRPNVMVMGGIGASIGLLAGTLGVGGGGLFTVALATLTALPHKQVLGTSMSAMVVPAVLAAGTYARMGQVRLRLVPTLIAGASLGSALGSRIALSAPDEVLQYGFGIVVFLLGLRMFRAPVKRPSNFGNKN